MKSQEYFFKVYYWMPRAKKTQESLLVDKHYVPVNGINKEQAEIQTRKLYEENHRHIDKIEFIKILDVEDYREIKKIVIHEPEFHRDDIMAALVATYICPNVEEVSFIKRADVSQIINDPTILKLDVGQKDEYVHQCDHHNVKDSRFKNECSLSIFLKKNSEEKWQEVLNSYWMKFTNKLDCLGPTVAAKEIGISKIEYVIPETENFLKETLARIFPIKRDDPMFDILKHCGEYILFGTHERRKDAYDVYSNLLDSFPIEQITDAIPYFTVVKRMTAIKEAGGHAWLGEYYKRHPSTMTRDCFLATISPIENFLLMEFKEQEKSQKTVPVNLSNFIQYMEQKIQNISTLMSRMSSVLEIQKDKKIPYVINNIDYADPIFKNKRTTETCVNLFLEKEYSDIEFGFIVSEDKPGCYKMFRFNDHPQVDFSIFREEKYKNFVEFAHDGGFMAITKQNTIRLPELIQEILVIIKSPWYIKIKEMYESPEFETQYQMEIERFDKGMRDKLPQLKRYESRMLQNVKIEDAKGKEEEREHIKFKDVTNTFELIGMSTRKDFYFKDIYVKFQPYKHSMPKNIK